MKKSVSVFLAFSLVVFIFSFVDGKAFATEKEQYFKWQIEEAAKIDCWWQCKAAKPCSTGMMKVNPGAFVARPDYPKGEWMPPNIKNWKKICGTPCRVVKIFMADHAFGGECRSAAEVKK